MEHLAPAPYAVGPRERAPQPAPSDISQRRAHHPRHHVASAPARPAIIMASSGQVTTYGQLEARANRGAHFFRSLGLRAGDVIALLLDNSAVYFEAAWAAQRAGLYFACISTKLNAAEIAYIVRDSGAKALICSPGVGDVLHELPEVLANVTLLITCADRAPYGDFDQARASMPSTPIDDERAGAVMLYSSGTTGAPKGVKPALTGAPVDAENGLAMLAEARFGLHRDSRYLCPAPLYHAAPLRWGMAVHCLGGAVVVMDKFDAEATLAAIDAYDIDVAQFVPTHFVRMLKLPLEVRRRYRLTSLRAAIHAAAPCPVPVKQSMMEWWGPILHEYYAGSEGNGFCCIGPQEWLARKGSVGVGVNCEVKICDEAGAPVPARTEGIVYFAGGPPLSYHNAPEKNAENTNAHGWTTLGDIGWVDEEGYLYLTDRRSFVIISGGVNIYPQEIENLLITHPKVLDVAVVGAPDEDMGEMVVAIVQPDEWAEAGAALRAELLAFCRTRLSHVKAPRIIEFRKDLPRAPTGKLHKGVLRDELRNRTTPKL